VAKYRITGLLVTCLGFAVTAAFGQAFTDMFADRQSLTGSSLFLAGSNSNATVEPLEPLHAGKVGGHSLWISWTAPDNGLLMLTTAGSGFDTLLGVYTLRSGTNNPLSRLREVAADDDDNTYKSLVSSLSFGATSNQTYQIAVDGFNGAVGDVSLQLTFLSSTNLQPTVLRRPGDQALRIGDPLILSVGIVRVKDMNLTWYLNGNPITGDSASPTLVIPNLQRTNLGFYTVKLQLEDDSFYSTPVEVQINSEGDQNILARYKAADAGQSGLMRAHGVTLGYNGTQIFNTTNSILDTNAPSICGAIGGAPYWFAYQAPTNGIMTVDTSGSSFPTLLGAFTYDGKFTNYLQLIPVSCDITNGPNGLPSQIDFMTDNGRNYFIVVDGTNGARGIAHLNYSLTPGFPAVAPLISTQPQSLTVAKQTAVAMNVAAGGTPPMAYQWYFNGTLLKNQTNASLLFNNPRTQDNGTYTAVVTNVVGAVTSAPAVMTVIAAPITQLNAASNWMISGFPATRGYQYVADCCLNGPASGWYYWTNSFPDYGGIVWLTNTIDNDALFLRVHSP
jgi:Ig-like domain-containing protein